VSRTTAVQKLPLALALACWPVFGLAQTSAPASSPSPAPTTVSAAAPATAPAPTPPWWAEITLNALVAADYSYNFNGPADGLNRLRVFDFDHNSFKIGEAELVVQRVARRGEAGFRVDAVVGASVPRIEAARGLFRDPATGRAGDFDLQQAYASYSLLLLDGIRIDAGKFVTPLGYEVVDGYDGYNDNISRSFLFGLAEPATHTGVRATSTLFELLTASLYVVNGWDNVLDNNAGKSVLGQLSMTPVDNLMFAVGYLGGPEQDGDDTHWRSLLDAFAQLKLFDRLTLALTGDYGVEARAGRQLVSWRGVAGYVRWTISDQLATTLRGELFEDLDGSRTGTAQQLRALTLTPELRLTAGWVLRGEVRLDGSSRRGFDRGGRPAHEQLTVAGNIIYVY